MSKVFSFDLNPWQFDTFFKPIREKKDIMILLLETLKYIEISKILPVQVSSAKIVLKVSKMSRLFFISENKSFSIVLPFTVIDVAGEIKFFAANSTQEIDSIIISQILTLLRGDVVLNETCVSSFADKILDIETGCPGVWHILNELLLTECGYLRYDYDVDRENGATHPLKHLDIFYNSQATFKVGLNNESSSDCLIDLLDTQTDCLFLE